MLLIMALMVQLTELRPRLINGRSYVFDEKTLRLQGFLCRVVHEILEFFA